MNTIVIIGGGLAAYTLARELRKLDKAVSLTIVMADDGAFYSKPMLSNALAQKKTSEDLAMSSATKMATDLGSDVRPHTRVTSIDLGSRQLMLNGTDGVARLAYDRLVLAVGADPIRLSMGGDAADAVLSINDRADYAAFRRALSGRRRVAILGAGLIGCEFANDLVGAGFEVTVFDVAPQPLGRLLPTSAGRFLADKLSAVGIRWRFGTAVNSVNRKGTSLVLGHGNGEAAKAEEFDLVLSAVGLKPRIGLAQNTGLKVNRGIVVDHHLCSSDPAVYALGDCAEVSGLVLPFVMPIMHGARALAATLGGASKAVTYPAMPVVVKTPACATVVSPPAMGAVGTWLETITTTGVRAVYLGAGGEPLGFALLGDAVQEKQALTAQLPGWL